MPKEQHMLPLVALQLPEELLGRDHYVALLDDLIGNIEVSDYNLSDTESDDWSDTIGFLSRNYVEFQFLTATESDTESDDWSDTESDDWSDTESDTESDDCNEEYDELLNHDPD